MVLYPAVDSDRLAKIVSAAATMEVVNASDLAMAQRAIADADGFYGKITADLLAAARRLRWVQTPTVSLEHYLFPALIEHRCVLTNMRGLFSDVIADHVFAYILCFARNLHVYLRQQWDRRWAPIGGEEHRVRNDVGPARVSPIDRAHRHIADATLGVLGMGEIGVEIARRGHAFSMTVLGHDPFARGAPSGVRMTETFAEFLAESDFVAIAAPHTPQTTRLFRRETMALMKPTSYLINIGRGAIVDLADLCAALTRGDLAGAALDVFETEPLPREHPLWGMPNVIITPHVAGYSPRIAERHLATLLDNVERFARGAPLRNVVDKERWF
jgi:phosphoglycerate dehydrogenase-like enzyme